VRFLFPQRVGQAGVKASALFFFPEAVTVGIVRDGNGIDDVLKNDFAAAVVDQELDLLLPIR
jgi:hypothetical protein